MDSNRVLTALMIGLFGVAGNAAAQDRVGAGGVKPTADIEAPPRTAESLNFQRSPRQDSVLAGGSFGNLPSWSGTVPGPCEINPDLTGCGGTTEDPVTPPGGGAGTPPPDDGSTPPPGGGAGTPPPDDGSTPPPGGGSTPPPGDPAPAPEAPLPDGSGGGGGSPPLEDVLSKCKCPEGMVPWPNDERMCAWWNAGVYWLTENAVCGIGLED